MYRSLKKSVINLYFIPPSPPCRAVLVGARAMGVHLNLIGANFMAGETQTPEYLKMNIQHTVPTLEDNGFYINESRAILQYLANKYCQDDSFYPQKDLQKRAKVDEMLQFDMRTLSFRLYDTYFSVIFGGASLSADKVENLDEALEYLEVYLKNGYAVGENMTIADFSLVATLSTIDAVGHDFSHFPNIRTYLDRMTLELDGYQELNQVGIDQFQAFARVVGLFAKPTTKSRWLKAYHNVGKLDKSLPV